MSENILKALMQLFAIIARPESNATDRRVIVESFLKQQLNLELVTEYLKVFDHFYNIYQQKGKTVTGISVSSVRLLRICSEINEELTQKQKVVVLIRLMEFIKTEGFITGQEFEFVETVAETFFIPTEEYNTIKDFVLMKPDETPDSPRILFIDNKKDFYHHHIKHIYSEYLEGQIRIYSSGVTNIFTMRYTGGSEIYLNGQLLQHEKVYVLTPGSSIRNPKIKPIYFSDIISTFYQDKIKSRIVFEVKDIEYKFKGGGFGLKKLSFLEESGKLVGIMGASGAGKSTLLNVLNGSYPPTSGQVMINGVDINLNKEKIEGIIGYVSQDDLLIEELTVYQNLYYNAKLCFDNYSEFQIVKTVLKTLQNLGLYEIKNMVVGSPLNKKISGGQRKRLNIALELIREPSVLFLDEPTSGLSSRDSENIMDLLKELTLKGKLVFVVIHQPSSDIFKMFDRLVILDTGGYLIYNGNPVDSIIYFKSRIHQANWNESECHTCGNVNPEQIFNIVESNVLDEYGNITHTRKIAPSEWNKHYKEYMQETKESQRTIPAEIPEISFKIPNKLRQFKVFVIRDVLSKLANKQYMIINMLESPFLAFLLSFIIRYYNVDIANEMGYNLYDNSNLPVYIFMTVIVAIFIGLTVSAEEIIKDRKIIKRESFLNLSRPTYLFSKVVILLSLSAIQALCFVAVGNTIMEIKGMYFEYWLIFFSCCGFSNLLGLNISDSFETAVTIYILIPFLVIPQIILSGVLVKFDKLNPKISNPNDIPWYGEIITARWGYEALAVYQYIENDYNKQFYDYEKIMSIADYKKNYWLPPLFIKVQTCIKSYNDPEKKEIVLDCLDMLRSEIGEETKIPKELSVKKGNDIREIPITFDKINLLYYDKVNTEILEELNDYLELLKKFYMKQFNNANMEKDNLVNKQQETEESKQKFLLCKKSYHNESLTEFVRNENSLNRIIEYNNRLYQKMDPVYQDPNHNFIKAHFYTPRKKIFGKFYHTYWVNVFVILFMTMTFYIVLYFRGLRKFLNLMAEVTDKFKQIKIFPSKKRILKKN